MTLISKVKPKKPKRGKLPFDWYKNIWFTDQVYVIRSPEVFNGWICLCLNPFEYKRGLLCIGDEQYFPFCRTSDGEFIHDFDGNNPKFEIEYLGKL